MKHSVIGSQLGGAAISTLLILAPAFLGFYGSHAQNPSVVKSASWLNGRLDLDSPVKATAVLRIELNRPARVRVLLVGPDGRRVRALVEDASWRQGNHQIEWDGSDDKGKRVPSEAYTPVVFEFSGGGWLPVFHPNAENLGQPVEITPLQWDPSAGKVLFSLPEAARVRIWVVHGDDGQILAVLRDMGPMERGLLSVQWHGVESQSGTDVRAWKSGFHWKGYSMPQCVLFVNNRDVGEYLKVRARYPLENTAQPSPKEDSSPLFRLEYGEQKALRFSAKMDGDTVVVRPEPEFLEYLARSSPVARVFFLDGSWVQANLIRNQAEKGEFTAKLPARSFTTSAVQTVVCATERDQWGYCHIHIGEPPMGKALTKERKQ